MIRLAANLSTLFTELPLERRFGAAAAAGFAWVEMQFPYALKPQRCGRLLRDAGLELVLFNAPAGELAAGERGLAFVGGSRLDEALDEAAAYVQATGCTRVHLLAGILADGFTLDLPRFAATLSGAARRMAREGAELLIEPLNPVDQPGYALLSLDDAATLRALAGEPNLFLQFDAYHSARRGEDPTAMFARHLRVIRHVQIADPTGRGEPDGAVMTSFLQALERSRYRGFVGCEYNPRGSTKVGLAWARRWLPAAPRHDDGVAADRSGAATETIA